MSLEAKVEFVARALARQRVHFNMRHRKPLSEESIEVAVTHGWPDFTTEALTAINAANEYDHAATGISAADQSAP